MSGLHVMLVANALHRPIAAVRKVILPILCGSADTGWQVWVGWGPWMHQATAHADVFSWVLVELACAWSSFSAICTRTHMPWCSHDSNASSFQCCLFVRRARLQEPTSSGR